MKCPICNTEARIDSSKNVIKGDKLFRKMTFICRNLGCDKYGKEVVTDYVPLEVSFEEETDET